MLYAFGSNGSGQLGLGHFDDAHTPTRVTLPDPVASKTPSKILAGGNHTLLLFPSGEIYACGQNLDGRCATSSNEPQHTVFHKSGVESPDKLNLSKFSLCAATWESSTLIDRDGHVFTSGTGNRGQLGHGPQITTSVLPRLIPGFPPSGTRVTDLAASMGHTVAVLSDGRVYGWGAGRKGQLGQPATDCWMPRKIEGVSFHAVRAACGKDFTYIVGDPRSGQHLVLGSDTWQAISSAPQDVRGWKEIAASWSSIYVVLHSGILLAWGRNDHRQIPSEGITSASMVAAGSEHVLVLSGATGACQAFGWGEHGNCGDLKGNQDAPTGGNPISTDAQILQAGAGCATSWIST